MGGDTSVSGRQATEILDPSMLDYDPLGFESEEFL
jgi:hypothetical protein